MKRKSIIFGISSTKLTVGESNILRFNKPWGVILFSRNISDLNQLKRLVKQIRSCVHDKFYPILIDQEGGAVSRLNKIIELKLFSQKLFGDLYSRDRKNFEKYYKIYIDKISDILNDVGININTVPVLDVLRKKTSAVIGNRAYSYDSNVVKKIGKICINLYARNKIATVVKHIPGHGLAELDSHYDLPIVVEKRKNLIKKDFYPFKDCNSQFAMTAHVLYKNYDPHFTATHSKIIIENIIRKKLNFRGILITDDISMKALQFGLKNNVFRALDAGCNLILHCNGDIKEMLELSKIAPNIDAFVKKKTSQFYNFLR